MVCPIFNDDPQSSLLHHSQRFVPSQQSAVAPHQVISPDPSEKGRQGFDSEAHRAFMRGLG